MKAVSESSVGFVIPRPVLKVLDKNVKEEIYFQILTIKRAQTAERKMKEKQTSYENFYQLLYINANGMVIIPKDHAVKKDIQEGDELLIDFIE
ncbi:MAG: hypothetical protein GF364_15275 [Candidatus Lokiarchaeota archaeon]|nr:hypothetical protein [Candidatus Lokiarchaeota archaeon]